MLKKISLCILVVLLSACQKPDSGDAIAVSGSFEQQPWFDVSNYEGERLVETLLEYEKSKVTLHIDDTRLRVSLAGDEIYNLPYVMEGRTLVAHDETDYYWVLYIKDNDVIHSSGIEYKRIKQE